jgi:hypothetical protein
LRNHHHVPRPPRRQAVNRGFGAGKGHQGASRAGRAGAGRAACDGGIGPACPPDPRGANPLAAPRRVEVTTILPGRGLRAVPQPQVRAGQKQDDPAHRGKQRVHDDHLPVPRGESRSPEGTILPGASPFSGRVCPEHRQGRPPGTEKTGLPRYTKGRPALTDRKAGRRIAGPAPSSRPTAGGTKKPTLTFEGRLTPDGCHRRGQGGDSDSRSGVKTTPEAQAKRPAGLTPTGPLLVAPTTVSRLAAAGRWRRGAGGPRTPARATCGTWA